MGHWEVCLGGGAWAGKFSVPCGPAHRGGGGAGVGPRPGPPPSFCLGLADPGPCQELPGPRVTVGRSFP